ncbi:MAG TPA: hypothetical protein VMT22_21195 [Terriglobales bacterium]|nr:hypothetical protein [Terriglobales bacterium]
MKSPQRNEQIEDLMMDLETADFSRFARDEQKAVAEDWLELTFDILDDEEIGKWELANLAEATGALLSGLYGLALISIRLALTVDEKVDDPWYRVRDDEFAGVTIEALRQAISFSRHQAVVPHPVFRGMRQ